jgi:hypothetical protein
MVANAIRTGAELGPHLHGVGIEAVPIPDFKLAAVLVRQCDLVMHPEIAPIGG